MKALAAIALSLASAGFLGPIDAIAASQYFFSIKEMSGPVRVKEPFDHDWKTATEEVELASDTIILVPPGVGAKLEVTEFYKGKRGKSHVVGLPAGVTVQLSAALLKPRFIEYQQFKSMDDLKNFTSADAAAFKVEDAFQKLYAVMNDVVQDTKAAVGLKQDQEKTLPLKILRPRQDEVLKAGKLPWELTIVWLPVPSEGVSYRVELWPKGSSPGAATQLKTQDTSASVRLPEYSQYFLRVSSADGAYQSRIVSFSLIEPLAENLVERSGDMKGILRTMTPPRNFVVRTPAKSDVQLVFSWRPVEGLSGLEDQGYELQIKETSGGGIVRRVTTAATSHVVSLRPGRYTWSVTARARQSGKLLTVAQSPGLALSVLDGGRSGLDRSTFLQTLAKGQGFSYFLESGLGDFR